MTNPIANNDGLIVDPSYVEQTGTNNPFDGINVGQRSAPTFADIDGDGDLDALVGEYDGPLNYFENTGSSTSPSYVERTGANNPFNGFVITNLGFVRTYSTPTFADIDGDGDLDAVVGNGRDALLDYFENTGSSTSPSYVQQTGSANPFDGFNNFYPYNSATFADIDADGDLDAVVGLIGNLIYLENTGSSTSPSYVQQTGTDNPFNGIGGSFLTPTLADIDEDGDLDAVVGELNGISYYENKGNITSPSYVQQTGTDNPFNGINKTFNKPTFADIDGDGDLDAVVGADLGNLNYFENNQARFVDPAFTTDEDTAFTTGNVLDNDNDPDGDILTVASIDTTGTLGTVTDNGDGTFNYDPNGQFESLNNGETATDRFNYTVSDGNGGTETATVTLIIDGVTDNTAPDAVDDAVTTDEDTAIGVIPVLANDGDADGDPLTVTGFDATGTVGTVTDNGDGTFNYDPNGQFESLNDGETTTDSFDYTITDSNGDTDTATVTITIEGVDDAPVLPPNSLESDYTIFTRNVSGIEYTVELANSQPVYTIDGTATNQSLNDFLTEAVLELGGKVVRNGTINENSLEHFGGNQNPSITENEGVDQVTIKIAGSGVGGQYKAEFDNNADANAFEAFAQDLLGKDPTKTKIFQFNGGTNGGANNIRILTNDEIVSLNPELSDGLRTTDSLEFKWSGADTSGTQVRNNFDDFIGEMGDLFGGDQLTNADIHVIPTLNEAELTGTQVEISNGLGDTETWDFNSEQEAQNFLSFFDSAVDAFAV